ncbi:MAG TPA: hypothetical protein VF184_08060 [Phycisphaeraceae bacterium]
MAEDPTDQELLTRVRQVLEHLRAGSAAADRQAVELVQQVSVHHGVVLMTVREADGESGSVDLTINGRPVMGDADMGRVERALGAVPGVKAVRWRRHQEQENPDWLAGPRTPLQDEMLESGVLPEPDPLAAPHLGLAVAEEAGYSDHGPPPLDGPVEASAGGEDDQAYRGPVPVTQWEVDPQSPSSQSGEADLTLDGWDFSLWWQVHPADLVYVSIQALRDDTNEPDRGARPHPVGRAVAVNLVYDQRRGAVVAVYGTARDFRPFIRAFAQAFGLIHDDTSSLSNSNHKDAAHEHDER